MTFLGDRDRDRDQEDNKPGKGKTDKTRAEIEKTDYEFVRESNKLIQHRLIIKSGKC